MDERHILTDKEWLLQVAELLEGEGREEGNVYLSQEFARMIAARLRAIVQRLDGEWIRIKPEVAYDLGPGPGSEGSDGQ